MLIYKETGKFAGYFIQEPEEDGSYTCHWTGVTIPTEEVVWTGAVIPGLLTRYASVKGSESARKASVTAFHESEENCNSCKDLIRVKHDRCKFGFLQGRCADPNADYESNPYANGVGEVFSFHPDDPMHMPCYKSRFSV